MTPTLMEVGIADGLARANLEDYLRLPNATLHVFSRVGHFVPSDVPEQFAAVLRDFMHHGVVSAVTLQQRINDTAMWRRIGADARRGPTRGRSRG